ncbi:MAG: prepilin-type N-terminal cleavage/methylation domain-containing protein [Pseudomonadota bacterium]
MNSGSRSPTAGFSLLEVLVALSILALSLGVILAIFSKALLGARLSESYTYATALAEARLAAAGNATPLAAGQLGGQEAGYVWQVQTAPYELPDMALKSNLAGFLVQVTVMWTDGGRARQVTLRTLKVQPAVL